MLNLERIWQLEEESFEIIELRVKKKVP